MNVAREARLRGSNLSITPYKLYKLGKLLNFFVPQVFYLSNSVEDDIPQRAVPRTHALISINYLEWCGELSKHSINISLKIPKS